MEVNQITYFLDIAETEHMTKSAKRLHVAQPALSRSISSLEKELGVALFQRKGRGLTLTDEGKLLKARLTPIAQSLADTQQLFQDMQASNQNQVRVRFGAGSRVASNSLAAWMADNSSCKILLSQLSDTDKEPDIVVDSSPVGEGASVCQRVVAFSERVMLAAPKSMKFDELPLSNKALQDLGFITLSSSVGFSGFMKEECLKVGFKPDVVFECDNPSVARKMISLGLGVGFWPEKSWGDIEGEVSLLPLEMGLKRSLYLSLTKSGARNPQAFSLYESMVAYFEEVFQNSSTIE